MRDFESQKGNFVEPQLSLVRWRDAYFELDASDEYPDDFIVETLGWSAPKGRFLMVMGEMTPEGPRCVTMIPNENVLEVIPIGPSPTQARDGSPEKSPETSRGSEDRFNLLVPSNPMA